MLVINGYLIWSFLQHRLKIRRVEDENKALGEQLAVKEEEVKTLMADNSMRLAFKEEWLTKLKNEILTTADANELRQSLNSLIAQLRLQIDTENKLAGLQGKIDINNISFDTKLQELYPDLTKGEREVCALLRLNLSIKEIMTIRNVSSDSVKSMRRRIRKKMQIPSEVELEKFIQELT
ncbi:helix-turn-helix transcriptional regulator [Aquimarina algiphila]|uniref:helix-turn-helix transcriptional regulator n=1 Tax=Aquimarina algiphila TaxID=2047982 RepID=UPI00248FED70|nr:LuxR C-terminal-related transcriptional regulator [Aquimarina algiphila]